MDNIKWFGHASLSFTDANANKIYYVDPFDLTAADLEKIIKEDTIIIAPPDILAKIDRAGELKQAVEPNKSYEIKSFKFQTVPAYNTHPDKLNFHPKTNNWVGYIFQLNGKNIYHAGDTDFIEEMKSLKDLNLDVAMLPIGGTYTMDVNEAAQAANAITAKITIPMHYRRLNPNNYQKLEEKFKSLVTNSKVVILEELM